MAMATDGPSMVSPSGMWVVPPPGTAANPAVSGAAPAYLALLNASGSAESYAAFVRTSTGDIPIATGVLAAGSTIEPPLSAAGLNPIIVRADGTMATSESANPSGGIGVVTMPGIPLAAPIGR